ncbi:MAG: hypothetical protein E7641_01095 [Ruminococcaceae bacterium]|nr:hypothetical protein [Oscillospiraceae bacterium]
MKRTIRITALLLVSLLLILSLTACGKSNAKSAEGTCENGLVWKYDSDTKTLSISGSGEMKDFTSSSEAPWAAVATSAKTVTISNGVTKVGAYAFYSFSVLENVTIPDSVTSLGKCSFAFNTALKNISLPASLISIGESAFEGCSALTAAFVPAGVQTMGARAFAFCSAVTDAAVLAPVSIPEWTFKGCRSLDKLLLNSAIGDDMIAANAFEDCKKTAADASRTESSSADASITVKYLDTEGNELHAPETRDAIPYGGSYSIVSPAIEGYTADKLTVSGYLYGANREETVTYTKNDVPAETTDNDENETEDEVGPSTYVSIAIFAIVLIGIAVAAVFLIRSEKKNAGKNTTTVRKNNTQNKKK